MNRRRYRSTVRRHQGVTVLRPTGQLPHMGRVKIEAESTVAEHFELPPMESELSCVHNIAQIRDHGLTIRTCLQAQAGGKSKAQLCLLKCADMLPTVRMRRTAKILISKFVRFYSQNSRRGLVVEAEAVPRWLCNPLRTQSPEFSERIPIAALGG